MTEAASPHPSGQLAPPLSVPRSNARREVTHDCEYQVVWCTKFARPLLEGLEEEARALLSEQAQTLGLEFLSLTINPDMVVLNLRVDPVLGIHRAVTQLKTKTSSVLRSRHVSLKTRAPSLWNSKYFVVSLAADARPDRLMTFLVQQRRG